MPGGSNRAPRAPGASCWACIVFVNGIIAIIAASSFGNAYQEVDTTAKCVLGRLENITGLDTNSERFLWTSDSTIDDAKLLNVPLALLNLVDSDFGVMEVAAVLPATVAAALYTMAVLIIWCPAVPNPTCSRVFVCFANITSFFTICFYMIFVAFQGAIHTPWVIRQLEAYEAECGVGNRTVVDFTFNFTNWTNASMLNLTNWTVFPPSAPPSLPPPAAPPPSAPPPGVPVPVGTNYSSYYIHPRIALRSDPFACDCLNAFPPQLLALWRPGTFAIVTLLLISMLGTTLRYSTPSAKEQARKRDLYGKYDVLYYRICAGDAGWWNLICFPVVLAYHGYLIYIYGCLRVVFARAYRFWCFPCICCWYVYEDDTFIGDAALGSAAPTDGSEIEWVRAKEVRRRMIAAEIEAGRRSEEQQEGSCCAYNQGCYGWFRAWFRACHSTLCLMRKGRMQLYEGKIEPADLCQGAIGNCWLVAALASAAEQPPSVRNAFITPEYNPRGRYDVRLFDPATKEFVTVTVDDRIPVKKGSHEPLYMKMHGDEVWAVILEKAFAKFCGSYGCLDGGWATWGWRVLTGDHCFRLTLSDGKWHKTTFEAKRDANGIDGLFYDTNEDYSPDEAWNLILNYVEAKGLVGASGGAQMGGGDNEANSGGLNGEQLNEDVGLVGTHAYSILDARELGLIPGLSAFGATKLVKLRNPWGSYEWKGAWSDGSQEWTDHPLVKARLQPKNVDDGTFWMPFDELISGRAGFIKIDFCDRTTKGDLNLKLKEDLGMLGIIFGCTKGLLRFLCCRGLWVIYFGNSSSTSTRSTKRGCCGGGSKGAMDVVEPATVNVEIEHRTSSFSADI